MVHQVPFLTFDKIVMRNWNFEKGKNLNSSLFKIKSVNQCMGTGDSEVSEQMIIEFWSITKSTFNSQKNHDHPHVVPAFGNLQHVFVDFLRVEFRTPLTRKNPSPNDRQSHRDHLLIERLATNAGHAWVEKSQEDDDCF